MRPAFIALLLLGLVACTTKPPIYILTKSAAEPLNTVKTARLDAQPVAKVNLRDFKRAFVKRYESEEAFLRRFHQDLGEALAPGAAAESPVFTVELPLLEVDSHSETEWTTFGGGTTARTVPIYTEYCDIRLSYAVKDAEGRVVLEGLVRESTDKGGFLHPNQSKLANAVAEVQRHLVDYLRGRLPAEHIALPAEPSASNAK